MRVKLECLHLEYILAREIGGTTLVGLQRRTPTVDNCNMFTVTFPFWLLLDGLARVS